MTTFQLLTCAVLAVGCLCVAACGGGSSSESTSASAESPSADFVHGKKSKGARFASFGQEADEAEREAASAVLEESFEDRAAKEFAKQCTTFSPKLQKVMVERAELITNSKNQTCAKGLELEAEPLPPSVLVNRMSGPIDVLRLQGDKGYALFHGNDGKDYGVQMVKEDGEWKVDELATYDLAEK